MSRGGSQCFHVDEMNNVRLWHHEMWGTAERGDGGRKKGDSHTQQSESSVTSTDRNRRACGGGCALFVFRLSESSHSRSYDWGLYKQGYILGHGKASSALTHPSWSMRDRYVWSALIDSLSSPPPTMLTLENSLHVSCKELPTSATWGSSNEKPQWYHAQY